MTPSASNCGSISWMVCWSIFQEELVSRVAEGRILGALPSCPKCKHGQVPPGEWWRLFSRRLERLLFGFLISTLFGGGFRTSDFDSYLQGVEIHRLNLENWQSSGETERSIVESVNLSCKAKHGILGWDRCNGKWFHNRFWGWFIFSPWEYIVLLC